MYSINMLWQEQCTYFYDPVHPQLLTPLVGMARPEKRRRLTPAVLPDDLLFSDILARLPVRSLARFRCVCRLWRAGIADPAFVRRHLDLSRAGRPPSVLAVPREVDPDDGYATSGDISFHRLPLAGQAVEAELMLEQAWPEGISCLVGVAHCDGLVAVATATDRLFVCNPATREFAALPLASRSAEAEPRFFDLPVPVVALGFDRWRSRYVVARFFYRTYGDTPDDISHEVFTLGGGAGAGSWERTEDPPLAMASALPACTRRAFYWHANVAQPLLLRFGLQHRAFDVVSRPGAGGWNSADDVAELDDGKKLCYVHAVGDAAFQVWMADDDDAPALEWSLRCRVDIPYARPNCVYNLMPIMADGEELVADGGSMLCRCDVRTGAVKDGISMEREMRYERPDGSRRCYYPCYSAHYLLPYVESLVSIA
ncbi:hypothetical protein ACP4OV_022851 [Aristida adscensionis]